MIIFIFNLKSTTVTMGLFQPPSLQLSGTYDDLVEVNYNKARRPGLMRLSFFLNSQSFFFQSF